MRSNGKLALALFSNTAFDLGLRVISILEQSQLGLQWDNVSEPLSIDNPLNMGAVFGMLICDILLYMIIAWSVYVMYVGCVGMLLTVPTLGGNMVKIVITKFPGKHCVYFYDLNTRINVTHHL